MRLFFTGLLDIKGALTSAADLNSKDHLPDGQSSSFLPFFKPNCYLDSEGPQMYLLSQSDKAFNQDHRISGVVDLSFGVLRKEIAEMSERNMTGENFAKAEIQSSVLRGLRIACSLLRILLRLAIACH